MNVGWMYQLTRSQQVHRLLDTGWSLYAPTLFGTERLVRSLSARSFNVLHMTVEGGRGVEGIKYLNTILRLALATNIIGNSGRWVVCLGQTRLKLGKRQNRHVLFGLRNAFPCRVVIT